MKQKIKILIISSIFFVNNFAIAVDDKISLALPKVVQKYLKSNFLNASFAFNKGDEVILQGADGVRDDFGARLTVNEVMPVASNTKSITAAAILKLQDQKKLNVHDYLIKYFGNNDEIWPNRKAPVWAKEITIHHLLTHTSGIAEYFGVKLFDENMSHQMINKKIVDYAVKTPLLVNKPGVDYHYSSTNYVLLGLIIEKLSGKSYANFVKEQFFDPLGMKNTYVISLQDAIAKQKNPKDIKLPNNYIVSLSKDKKEFKIVQLPILVVPYADGGIASNTNDMLKWYYALTNNKVISEESYKIMTKKHYELKKPLLGKKSYTGYGIYISDLANKLELIHGAGSIPGVRSEVGYIPGKNFYYAVLSNVSTHNLEKKKIDKNMQTKTNKLDIKFFLGYLFKNFKFI